MDDEADDDSDRADLAPAPVGESGGDTVAALHWPQASRLSLKLPCRFDDGGLETSVLAIVGLICSEATYLAESFRNSLCES
jgi:hypothetical protein